MTIALPNLKRALPILLLLALAAGMRLSALSWGLPSPDLPKYPSHYDENLVLGTMKQINFRTGDFNPESAHLGGPFAFYIWIGAGAFMWATGFLEHLPQHISSLADPSARLFIQTGRFTIVLADLASIFLVYLIALKMTRKRKAALLGAFIFAIIPFEIIHSLFMRPHTLGNTLALLTILLSFNLYKRRDSILLHAAVGVFVGLAMATRYHLLALLIIPLAVILYDAAFMQEQAFSFRLFLKRLLRIPLIALFLGVPAGLFIGAPYLFLDFQSSIAPLQMQQNASAFDQFSIASLLDFSKPWKYFSWVVPSGLFALTLPLYASVAFLPFCRKYWKYFLPLMIFTIVYWHITTKGYGLWAVRVLLPILPIFALFFALSADCLTERKIWRNKTFRIGAYALLTIIVAATLHFDVAYLRSMAQQSRDPYVQLYEFFRSEHKGEQLKVGIYSLEWDRYHLGNFLTIINTATGIEPEFVASDYDYEADDEIDYIILFDFDSSMTERIDAKRSDLTQGGRYKQLTSFVNPLSFTGISYDYSDYPTDMRYPCPYIYLFAKTK